MEAEYEDKSITITDVMKVFLNWAKLVNLVEGYEFIPLPVLRPARETSLYLTNFFDIAYNYLKKKLVFDFICCVPILAMKFYYVSNQNNK